MKRSSKILAALLAVVLLFGIVAVIISSAATAVQDLQAGTATGGYVDFDNYTDNNAHSNGGTQWPNFAGSKIMTYSTRMATAGTVKINSHTVDGRTNKYLNIVSRKSHNDISDYATFAFMTYDSSNRQPFDQLIVTKPDDYFVIDFDIKADSYFVVETVTSSDESGVETTTKNIVTYSTWDEVVAAGKENEATLTYPKGFYIAPYLWGYNSDGSLYSSKGYTYIYIVKNSSNNRWYLSSNDSYDSSDVPLSNEAGHWNHVTMVISAPNVEKTSYNNKIKLWAYVDGDYAFSKETTGYSAACGKKAMLDRVAFNISKSVANGDESCHYAFGLDNFVINAYTNYTPTTDNNLKSFMAAGGKGSLSSLDDVLFNEDYISPNGNSFTLDWVDLSGDKIFSEQQKLGGTPSADKSELDGGSYMGVKGNYKNLAAWEWNVSEDADVFTPVSALTLDNVKTVRARGSKSITVRPAVIDVDWVDDEGSSVGVEQYFAGSTVESFNTATNGWYSLEYFAIKNATEGEAEDSFIAVYGKENKFVVDDSFATPTASISGIRYNMSLLTNYYMNIYVPNDTPENVEILGFYAEETLENKYTTGTRTVSIGGTVYRELSFGVANSDIDVNLPKYVGIKVTLGGEEHLIAYKVSVNALSYSKGVLDVYGCESNEARLVVNLLNYANEAYKLVKGEANSSALSILAEHSECGCILSGNVDDEYKGSVDTLSGYLYGAAYNVTSAQPSMMLYLLSSKASEVTGIRVSYDGIEGEKIATLTALPEISIDGKSVIPYSYSTISASDVNEVMTVTVLGEDGMPLANGTYALANYAFNNDVKVANALFAFSKAAAAYKKSVIGAPESPSVIEGITAYKTSNLRPSTTLDNGHTIIYTISVTNNNPSAITVPVNDRIPANTLYVSGAESVRGFDLSWNLDVPAGGTVSVSYVVRVDSNKNLLNRVSIKAPTALAGGVEAECTGENYVKRTLNAIDREFIDTGINAISFTENIAPVDAVKMMYNVAFSKYFTMSGSISDVISAIFESTETSAGVGYRKMVIPTLYGGSSLSSALDSRFVGERAEAIAIGDLIEGDILFIRDSEGSKMYICDSDGIVSLTNGYERVSASQVVDAANSANYYAALRPSMVMSTRVPFEFYGDDSDLTDEQIALVETAKSYILRGYRLQYDDGGMADYSEYRWQIGKYELEEYTSQKWGYINCAGFTYDIYRTALGQDLNNLYTTKSLMNYFTNGGKESSYYPFYYEWNAAAATDKALQAEVEARFFDTLEVGDLIVVTRGTAKGGYGHVMMYVGNGIVAHSSGSTRSGDTEYYEATIRYMNIRGYLFDPTASNYLFNETTSSSSVYQTCIVRPLSSYKGQIPENTLNRMENLEGILSEKLSSHPEGMTANKGEEVTFTYKINNTGKTVKTLTVTDVVPANATLKYADGAVVDGNDLSWTVTVEPNETVTVSYTVIATGENGSYIYSDAGKVGGVRHTCPKVYIAPTLTAADQQAILDAVAYYRSNNTNALTSFALINAIYEKAGLEAPFVDADGNDVTSAALRASLFKTSSAYSNMWELNTSSEYYDMVIPTLYGGGKYYTKNYYSSTNKTSSDRSRLPREQALCFGDILVVRFSSSDALYMYVGSEHLINLNASLSNDSNYAAYHRLQRMLSVGNYYAILRPSMGGDITIEDKYTVTFDSNGGSEVGSVRISASGVSVSEPAEPSRAQHNFLGWYLNGEKYDFTAPVTSDITLTAMWEATVEDTEVYSKMQSVLLIGQSNMVGQGDVMTVDPISDDRLYMMRDDRWVKMQEPLHINSHQAGIGLGASFGKAFVETFDCELGLIPAAKGATTLEMWAVGGDLYNEAVRKAKVALETTDICAILWHQGEGNQYDEEYAEKLQVIFDAMIEELGLDADKLIIITGELSGSKGDTVHTPELVALGTNYKNYGIAESDGLVLMSDKTHFDAPSLRVFGYRYFNIFYNLTTGRSYEFDNDPDSYYSVQTPIDENTYFPFDELVTGTAPSGPVGSGTMGIYLQNGKATIVEESDGNKYLSVSNGTSDTASTGYSSTFVNSYNAAEAGSVFAAEAKFKLGEGSDCNVYLLMIVTEDQTNGVYKSVMVDAKGTIYSVTASGARTAVGTMTTDAWTTIKVVCDTAKNTKSLYIDGVCVMENVILSTTADPSALDVVSTTLAQFSTNYDTTIGTIHIDEYRFYPVTE